MNELHELHQLLRPYWRQFDTKKPPDSVILASGYKVSKSSSLSYRSICLLAQNADMHKRRKQSTMGHFRVCLPPLQSESECEVFLMKNSFHSSCRTNYHHKNFALRFALKR